MLDTPDLPAALLDAIRDDPEDWAGWTALADWLWLHDRGEEAAVVRVMWPALRDNLVCASLEQTLADVGRNVTVLADAARKVESQADGTATGETQAED